MSLISRCLMLAPLALFALATKAPAQGKPDLVMVSVGVSKFRHKTFEGGVRASSKDALDIARAYLEQQGKLFHKVEGKMLVDGNATRANVESALAWAKKLATDNSYVVVFLSSHGGPDDLGEYLFYPHDANPHLPSTALPSKVLRQHLKGIQGQVFLILDTCHAGGCNRLSGVDIITLAACSASEVSSEQADPRKGNGFFTRAFVEGFRGKADSDRDGTVTLAELETYVADRLDELSKGKQRFTVNGPEGYVRSTPMARLRIGSTVAIGKKD